MRQILPLFPLLALLPAGRSLAVTPASLWQYDEPKQLPETAKRYSATADESQDHLAGSSDSLTMKLDTTAKYQNGLDTAGEAASYQDLVASGTGPQKIVRSSTTYDRYLGHRVAGFLLNTYEYNETRSLKYDLQTGGGAKYDLLRNAFWELNVGVAYLNLTRKSNAGIADENKLLSYRLKLVLDYEKSALSFTGFYQPSVIDRELFWSTATDLQVDLTPTFYVKVSFVYRYESRPLDPEVKRWDQEESTSLGLKL